MARPTHDPLTDQQVRAALAWRDADRRARRRAPRADPHACSRAAASSSRSGIVRRASSGGCCSATTPACRWRRRARWRRKADQRSTSGDDPAAERQAARRAPEDTVEALAADYLKKHAAKKRTAAEDERILDVDVLPYWRARSVRELTRRDVRALVERVSRPRRPDHGESRARAVRKMLNFAVEHDWIDANPAARDQETGAGDVPRPGTDRRRDPPAVAVACRTTLRPTRTGARAAAGERRKDDPICPVSPAHAAIRRSDS